jgi:hypothetical protein
MSEEPQPQPKYIREPDDIDPKEYAHRVANPFWMHGLEGRIRYALERAGFEVEHLLASPDESQATFRARRGPQAQFTSLAEARASLIQNLNAADCHCGNRDLTLAVEDDRWEGVYIPYAAEDDIDPMDYVNAAEPPNL